MAWFTMSRAAAEAAEVSAKPITGDQLAHWIGSGHFPPECVRQRGRHREIRDDALYKTIDLWAKGGKAYLPLWRGREKLITTTLAAYLLAVQRHQVNKLAREGRLQSIHIGHRGFVPLGSLCRLIEEEPWRANQAITSDLIALSFGETDGVTEVLRTSLSKH